MHWPKEVSNFYQRVLHAYKDKENPEFKRVRNQIRLLVIVCSYRKPLKIIKVIWEKAHGQIIYRENLFYPSKLLQYTKIKGHWDIAKHY